MSCSSCQEVIDPNIPFLEFPYIPNRKFQQESFVKIPNKPTKGWRAVVTIKGMNHTMNAENPRQVAYEITKLAKLNGFQVDKNQLWFNLNIQWLERTPDKYHLVGLAELLEAAQPQPVVSDDKHAIPRVSIDTWNPGFWSFLKIYVESETYEWDVFRIFLNQYKRILNPSENALLGDSGWYRKFTIALGKLEKNPAFNAEQAKVWINNEISV